MSISSKAFLCITVFISIFGRLAGENAIYHIPPSPPTVGNSVSFEAIFISIDLEVNGVIFFYRMKGQKSYKEIEMVESLGGAWSATISKYQRATESNISTSSRYRMDHPFFYQIENQTRIHLYYL